MAGRWPGGSPLWPGALLLLGTCLQSAVGMRVLVCAGVCVTVRAGAHGRGGGAREKKPQKPAGPFRDRRSVWMVAA